MRIKPILFNTDMVRAILDGRKTVTRRVMKPQPPAGASVIKRASDMWMWKLADFDKDINPPYHPGDILYVQEAFSLMYESAESNKVVGYMYKANPTGENAVKEYDRKYPDGADYTWDGKWHPSIHMPKEATRIWLKVTDVRVDRLHDMNVDDVLHEGVPILRGFEDFKNLWNSTIKKKDLPVHGWDASPWVWVIEFERYEKLKENV